MHNEIKSSGEQTHAQIEYSAFSTTLNSSSDIDFWIILCVGQIFSLPVLFVDGLKAATFFKMSVGSAHTQAFCFDTVLK